MSDYDNKNTTKDDELNKAKSFVTDTTDVVEAGVRAVCCWFIGSYADELQKMRDFLTPETKDPFDSAFRLIIIDLVCKIGREMKELGVALKNEDIKEVLGVSLKVVKTIKRLDSAIRAWEHPDCPKFGRKLLEDIIRTSYEAYVSSEK